MPSSFSKKLVDVLENIVGTKKTESALGSCFRNAVYKKIQTKLDIMHFLSFLEKNNIDIAKLTQDINNLIQKINREKITDYVTLIEDIYSQNLGDMVNILRLKYSLSRLLPYVKSLIPLQNYTYLQRDLGNYIESLSPETFEDIDEVFKSLDNIFLKYTNNTFIRFQTRFFLVVEKYQIDQIYNKWRAPKFRLVRKYSWDRKKPREENFLGTRIGELRDDDETLEGAQPSIGARASQTKKLQKIDAIVGNKFDTTLGNDFSMLDMVTISQNPDQNPNPAKYFWKSYVFDYLRTKNLRPRVPKRNGLYVIVVWLFSTNPTQESLHDIARLAENNGLVVDIQNAIPIVGSMFTELPNSDAKNTFSILFDSDCSTAKKLGKIEHFLGTQQIPPIQAQKITKEIGDILPSNNNPITKKIMEDAIYTILKKEKRNLIAKGRPIVNYFTRKFIREHFC